MYTPTQWDEEKNRLKVQKHGIDFKEITLLSRKSGTERKQATAPPGGKIGFADIPELDESFFRTAAWRPAVKQPVTIRIDADVLEWFRSRGRGYQTQINRLLRRYMETHKEQG